MTADDRIYGILTPRHVRLRYDTDEEQQEADRLNARLNGLGQVYRAATDWGYRAYDDMLANMSFSQWQRFRQEDRKPRQPPALKSGDLVRVFKTVTDGDVCWQGVIKLDRSEHFRGTQAGENAEEWQSMFFDALPAKLVRKDGRTIFGALEPFCETGTEGIVWSVQEYGKEGYAGLNCLEDGDQLTVYSRVRNGEVEWEGAVDFGPNKVTKIGWTEVLREARHMETEKWLQWSWQRRPVVVTPL